MTGIRTAASPLAGFAAAYVTVIAIWSTTSLAIKWSAEDAGVVFAVAGRMALGAVAALAVLRVRGQALPLHRRALLSYCISGGGFLVGMSLVYWSSTRIPSGLMAVLFGLAPLLTSLCEYLLPGERSLTWRRLLGIALGLFGVTLVFLSGVAVHPEYALGIGVGLLAVLLHVWTALGIRHVGHGVPALAITTGGLWFSLPGFAAWLAYAQFSTGTALPDFATLSPRAILCIVYLGLVGSVLGFALYYHLVTNIGPARTSYIMLVTPITALILGNVLNDEVVGPRAWAGALCVVAGLAVYQLAPSRSRAPADASDTNVSGANNTSTSVPASTATSSNTAG